MSNGALFFSRRERGRRGHTLSVCFLYSLSHFDDRSPFWGSPRLFSLPLNAMALSGGLVVVENASVLTLDSSIFEGNQAPKACLAGEGEGGGENFMCGLVVVRPHERRGRVAGEWPLNWMLVHVCSASGSAIARVA